MVSRSTCPLALYGGPIAELAYTYRHAGGYYASVHSEPFILRSSAEEFAAQFTVGSHIVIRMGPKRPEDSIFRQDYQGRIRLPLSKVAIDGQRS
jgi:hypothetical protein